MRAAIATLALCTLAGVAHADDAAPGDSPPAQVEKPTPTWMFTVGGLLRATGRDGSADADVGELEDYGYVAKAATMTGLRGDLAYGNAPIVDLGVSWAWARATYARGPAYADPDEVTGSTLELGVFARVHWVRRDAKVAAEPRAEFGVARSSVDLRGASRRRVGAYTRLGLDFRLGARKAGVVFSVDYTAMHLEDDMDLDVPTGGVTFALSFYWRQWGAPSPSASPSPR